MTAQGAAQALATLLAIISDQEDRPDLRPQAAIDHEMTVEQRGESRRDARRNPTAGESESAARRWAP